VHADEERVVHDIERRQEFDVLFQLGEEEVSLSGAKVHGHVAVDPVEVLEGTFGVFFQMGFVEFAAYGGAFEVVGLVDIFVGRED